MPRFQFGSGRFTFEYRERQGTDPTTLVARSPDVAFQDVFECERDPGRCFSLLVADHSRNRSAHFYGVFVDDYEFTGGVRGVLAHVVEETGRLWLAVGNEVRVYDLEALTQVGQESTFIPYELVRTSSTVVLITETDVFGWSFDGKLRWSSFVDPPHNVTLRDGFVYIESAQLGNDNRPGTWRFHPDASPLAPERVADD